MVAAKQSFFEKAGPVLFFMSIVMAFGIGVLWQKVTNLEKGGTPTTTTTAQPTTAGTAQATTVDIAQIKELFKKDVIKFGNDKRKVLFVEFSDPSCPYCHLAAGLNSDLATQSPQFKPVKDGGTYLPPVPEMKKLVDEGKASFVWIYMPGHGNGEMGSKALYCAQEKGKFWEAHDLLMTSAGYTLLNNTVKNDKAQAQTLADFLKSAVNAADMKKCLDSGKYDQRIADETALARSLGVSGTPGFFVNDTQFKGAYSFKDMQSVVDAALKS